MKYPVEVTIHYAKDSLGVHYPKNVFAIALEDNHIVEFAETLEEVSVNQNYHFFF